MLTKYTKPTLHTTVDNSQQVFRVEVLVVVLELPLVALKTCSCSFSKWVDGGIKY